MGLNCLPVEQKAARFPNQASRRLPFVNIANGSWCDFCAPLSDVDGPMKHEPNFSRFRLPFLGRAIELPWLKGLYMGAQNASRWAVNRALLKPLARVGDRSALTAYRIIPFQLQKTDKSEIRRGTMGME